MSRHAYSLSDAAHARILDRLHGQPTPIGPLCFRNALRPENPGSPWTHYVAGFLLWLRDRAETGDKAAVWAMSALAITWGTAWGDVRRAETAVRDALRERAYYLGLPHPVYTKGPGETIPCPEGD